MKKISRFISLGLAAITAFSMTACSSGGGAAAHGGTAARPRRRTAQMKRLCRIRDPRLLNTGLYNADGAAPEYFGYFQSPCQRICWQGLLFLR